MGEGRGGVSHIYNIVALANTSVSNRKSFKWQNTRKFFFTNPLEPISRQVRSTTYLDVLSQGQPVSLTSSFKVIHLPWRPQSRSTTYLYVLRQGQPVSLMSTVKVNHLPWRPQSRSSTYLDVLSQGQPVSFFNLPAEKYLYLIKNNFDICINLLYRTLCTGSNLRKDDP